MRPEDYDVLAKLIAQKVKQVASGLEQKSDTRIDDLIAENKALKEDSDALRVIMTALTKTVGEQSSVIEATAELAQNIGKTVNEINIDLGTISADVEVVQSRTDAHLDKRFIQVDDALALANTRMDTLSKTQGPKGDRGEPGMDGVAPTEDQVIQRFTMTSSFSDGMAEMIKEAIPEPVAGPRGEPGTDAPSTKDVAEMLLSHTPIVKMVAESDEVGRLIGENVENLLPSHIPEPVAGPKGDDGMVDEDYLLAAVEGAVRRSMPDPVSGADGVDGIDRPVLDIQSADAGQPVEKGIMVAHNGGLWMTKRRSKGDPTEDPGSFLLVLSGVTNVTVDQIDARTVRVTHTRSDGGEEVGYFNTHAVMHRGMWKVGEEYDLNDETMSDGSTWRCVADKTSARPGDNGDWKLTTQAKTGKKGLRGDNGQTGSDGEAGRGIKQFVWVDEAKIAVEYDDGSEEIIEIRKGDNS